MADKRGDLLPAFEYIKLRFGFFRGAMAQARSLLSLPRCSR